MHIFALSPEADESLFVQVTGQPFLVSLLLVAAIIFVYITVLTKLGLKTLHVTLATIPLLLVLAVVYFQHGPLVATVLLSVGFLLSFILAFAQLGGK